jgi:transposase
MSELLKDQHRLVLRLSEAECVTLQEGMRHHPRAAVRERCAALLKVAEGTSPHAVARAGLLFARDLDSVYRWLNWYQQEGIVGLLSHQQGGNQRGRL